MDNNNYQVPNQYGQPDQYAQQAQYAQNQYAQYMPPEQYAQPAAPAPAGKPAKKGNGVAVVALCLSIISIILTIVLAIIMFTNLTPQKTSSKSRRTNDYDEEEEYDRKSNAAYSVSMHNWSVSSVNAEIQAQL